jgi:hypothetical protein
MGFEQRYRVMEMRDDRYAGEFFARSHRPGSTAGRAVRRGPRNGRTSASS